MSFVYVCHSLHIALWNNIHFIEVTKDFKSKYESLKDKEIYILCYQKPYSKKTLFFFFKQEDKIKFQIDTSLYSLWSNSYSFSQSNKDFKGSLVS